MRGFKFHLHRRRSVAIGVATLSAAALAGGAYAATENMGGQQAFVNDAAKRLNVQPAQLKSALKGAADDQIQAAVTAGRLTQSQANAIEKQIANGGGPAGLFGGGAAAGPGMGHFGLSGGPTGAISGEQNAAETYLGLTGTQLMSDLQGGKSLAQIATAQGKTVSGLEASLTAALKTTLDKAVAANELTSSREQQILSNASTMITSRVNQTGLGSGPPAGFKPPAGYGPAAGSEAAPWGS